MWQQLFLVTLLVYGGLAIRRPLVYWSMDKWKDDDTLLPDIGSERRYSCNMSPLRNTRYKTPGVVGNATRLQRKSVDLIDSIGSRDCVRNPVKCEEGLSIVFWANVEQYTYKKYQVLAMTTTITHSLPGYFIGGDDDDEDAMLFLVRTANGTLYSATIPRDLSLGKWAMLGFTWSFNTGLQVSVNGRVLTDSEYISPPSVRFVARSYPNYVSMIAGNSLGPIFSMDEFRIYYEKISDKDLAELHEMGVASGASTVEPYPPSTARTYNTTTITTTPTSKTTTTTTKRTTTTTTTTTQPPARTTSHLLYTAPRYITTKPAPDELTYPDMVYNTTSPEALPPAPTEPPNGVFTMQGGLTPLHHQTWVHILIIATGVLLAILAIWMIVTYCCNQEKEIAQTTACEEPLFEKRPEQAKGCEADRLATTVA